MCWKQYLLLAHFFWHNDYTTVAFDRWSQCYSDSCQMVNIKLIPLPVLDKMFWFNCRIWGFTTTLYSQPLFASDHLNLMHTFFGKRHQIPPSLVRWPPCFYHIAIPCSAVRNAPSFNGDPLRALTWESPVVMIFTNLQQVDLATDFSCTVVSLYRIYMLIPLYRTIKRLKKVSAYTNHCWRKCQCWRGIVYWE